MMNAPTTTPIAANPSNAYGEVPEERPHRLTDSLGGLLAASSTSKPGPSGADEPVAQTPPRPHRAHALHVDAVERFVGLERALRGREVERRRRSGRPNSVRSPKPNRPTIRNFCAGPRRSTPTRSPTSKPFFAAVPSSMSTSARTAVGGSRRRRRAASGRRRPRRRRTSAAHRHRCFRRRGRRTARNR